jgi:YD repeat-containing protein
MFKASAANDATPGDYVVQLAGSETGGSSAAANWVTVTVRPAAPSYTYYLPVIFKRPPLTGPWYMESQTSPPDGAIVPTRVLTAAGPLGVQAAPAVRRLSLGGEPLALAVVDDALGAVLLGDGRLLRVDLAALAIRDTILVGPQPQVLARGDAAQLFVGLDGGIAQVDLAGGQILATTPLPGRITALAWDAAGQRLFAADAQNDQLLVLTGSPPRVTRSLPLPEKPGLLVFDATANRLFIAFPGAKLVIALDAIELTETNRAQITGGPILDLALDTGRHRLIVLNALAPGWRGLTLLDTELRQLALAAGADLRSATALALSSAGHLLLPEAGGLVQIDGDSLAVEPRLPLPALTPAGGIAATGRAVYLIDVESQSLLEVSQ